MVAPEFTAVNEAYEVEVVIAYLAVVELVALMTDVGNICIRIGLFKSVGERQKRDYVPAGPAPRQNYNGSRCSPSSGYFLVP